MIFSASSEIDVSVESSSEKVRNFLEPAITLRSIQYPFDNLKIEIFYSPIIMTEIQLNKYKSRYKLNRKKKIYYCSPQLKYKIFSDGTFEQMCREYILGLSTCFDNMRKLGASDSQIITFKEFLCDLLGKNS